MQVFFEWFTRIIGAGNPGGVWNSSTAGNQIWPFSKETVERSRCELAATAREFAATKPDVKEFSLEREHLKVLSELWTNRNLVITRPDKGRATVIMTKTGYVEKMMKILGDKRKFLTLGPVSQFDQTAKTEQHLRSYLNQLKEKKDINDDVFERIAPTGSQMPRMYGLPKIHKPIAPLRPILSMCGSAQYDASKWLCEILKPVLDYYNVRSIKDSFTFVDKIRKTGVPRDGYMCSFDVVNRKACSRASRLQKWSIFVLMLCTETTTSSRWQQH